MLKFFKKSGFKEKSKSTPTTPTSSSPLSKSKSYNGFLDPSFIPISSPLSSFEAEEEMKLEDFTDNERHCINSLNKVLPKILADKSALGYFIQYMELRGDESLIKFYLEVDCFCSAYSCDSSEDNKKLSDIRNDSSDNSASKSDLELDNASIDSNVNSLFEQGLPLSSCQSDTKSNNLPKINSLNHDRSVNKVKCKLDKSKEPVPSQDALHIFKKYISKSKILGPNRIPEDLKSNIENSILNESIDCIISYLSKAQKIVYRVLEDEYINDFLRSDLYCKHQIDVFTCGNVKLSDILNDEVAFFYFMEFMELESKRELLDFWMSATNYKQSLFDKGNTVDTREAQEDALIIYEKYFSLQAASPLGFSDKIRFQIEQNICREDGKPPQPDCFDQSCQVVYLYLRKYYLPSFLQSEIFYKYLSEMLNGVQNNSFSTLQTPLKRKVSESDCSSEISSFSSATNQSKINNNNSKSILKKSCSTNGGLHIDLKEIYDPDSLWRRNKSGLSVGYVDNLGRFVTEIEPDPCQKYDKSTRLSRAVKRLVNIEQDEVKEESAWKIAEMIVRDVTSLTLGDANTVN